MLLIDHCALAVASVAGAVGIRWVPSGSSATAAYYAAARAAEGSRSSWLATVGRFLLGGVARTPVYLSSKLDPDR